MLVIKQDQERLEQMDKQVNLLEHMFATHVITEDEFNFELNELKGEYRDIHERNRELNEPKEELKLPTSLDDMFDSPIQQIDTMFNSLVHKKIEEIENER